MDSWCKGSEERVRWQRRIRSRTESDTDSNACDAIGITDANADSRANNTGITESGAIGISGSNPGTEPNTVDDSDSHSKANSGADSNRDSYSKADSVGISESVTGTVGDQEPEPCKLVPSPNEIKPAAQCRQQL